MRVFLLFIDGWGLGEADPASNPLLSARLPHLTALLGGRLPLAASLPLAGPPAWAVPTDARLGVPGLPQSATGQTTILTGQNAPLHIGRHLNGYPTPRLKTLLREHSLFKQVAASGRRATFLNAYRPVFFQAEPALRQEFAAGGGLAAAPPAPVSSAALQAEIAQVRCLTGGKAPRRAAGRPDRPARYRPSASTVAVLAAGLPFRSLDDALRGNAVYHDITLWTLRERGFDVPLVDPAKAGRIAARVSAGYDFTMYEHFLTDLVGHSQDHGRAVRVLETLDAFIGGLLAELDGSRTLLLITSDHGNIEDLSVKTHTTNPVPTLLVGAGARQAAQRIADLTDIAPAVRAALA